MKPNSYSVSIRYEGLETDSAIRQKLEEFRTFLSNNGVTRIFVYVVIDTGDPEVVEGFLCEHDSVREFMTVNEINKPFSPDQIFEEDVIISTLEGFKKFSADKIKYTTIAAKS